MIRKDEAAIETEGNRVRRRAQVDCGKDGLHILAQNTHASRWCSRIDVEFDEALIGIWQRGTALAGNAATFDVCAREDFVETRIDGILGMREQGVQEQCESKEN